MLINLKKTRKLGEGSLHPQPKGWGIRDPPRSLCIKQEEVEAKDRRGGDGPQKQTSPK